MLLNQTPNRTCMYCCSLVTLLLTLLNSESRPKFSDKLWLSVSCASSTAFLQGQNLCSAPQLHFAAPALAGGDRPNPHSPALAPRGTVGTLSAAVLHCMPRSSAPWDQQPQVDVCSVMDPEGCGDSVYLVGRRCPAGGVFLGWGHIPRCHMA